MKKIQKIGVLMLCISMIVSMFSINSLAASGSVNVSSASGTVGSTVTVKCTASISGSSIGGADVVLTYNSAALQLVECSSGANGSSGSVYYSQFATGAGSTSLSFTMKFKILKEGSFGISVSNAEVYDWDTAEAVATGKSGGSITGKAVTTDSGNSGNTGNGGNSGTGNGGTGNSGNQGTTGTTTPEKDTNSKLSGLNVYPGSLSPAFNANTTSYTVKVTDEVKDVAITATAQSSKANVRVTGGKGLEVGSNQAKVVVTAESGATTVYNITIVCEKVEKISVDGTEYIVNENFTEDQIPTGFVKTTLKYNEKEYAGLSHEKGNLKLLCLKNAEKGSTYYIYDTDTQTFTPFVQITITEGKYIIPVAIYETVEFAETTTLTLQGKKISAWKIDDDFSVINAINAAGENVLYKYDSVDGTYQRYSKAVPEKMEIPAATEPVPEKKGELINFLETYGWYIIIALGVIVVILLLVLIYILATKNRRHNARKRRIRKKKSKMNEQDSGEKIVNIRQ